MGRSTKKISRNHFSRKINTRVEKEYFLITCEAEKTEPYYFEAIKKKLKKEIASIEIVSKITVEKDVIKKINTLNERRSKLYAQGFDHVWVVFDKNDKGDQIFNSIISECVKNNIKCAYSNEAFELWYLLHFDYVCTAISRKQYIDLLRKKLGDYKKNDQNNYRLIISNGSQQTAIKNARKLYDLYNHKSPAKENPSTTVFLLVESLMHFMEN